MSMEDGSADSLQLLREVLKEIQAEEPPSAPDQQEMYFQEHVGQGEQLAALGEYSSAPLGSRTYRYTAIYDSQARFSEEHWC